MEVRDKQTDLYPGAPGRFGSRGAPMRFPSRGDLALSPLLVFYEVTRACDLVCAHCRACAQPAADPQELSTELARRLIEQLATFPVPPNLVFTGGDPLKRPDIYQLIEHAVRCGLDASITPSATPLVTPEAIGRLRQAGISRLAVSIDGPRAAVHDAVRGVVGSFDSSLRILAGAHAEGIATQVNTTLTPDNFDCIEEMAELLAERQIAMWSVFLLVPTGRAADAPRLTGDECEAAFERLWQQAQRQPYRIKTTEGMHYRRFVRQRASAGDGPTVAATAGSPLHLNDGRGVMFVSHIGEIQPSGFLPIACGRFPQDDVVSVYQRSPLFTALRDADRLEGKCGQCEYRNICGGSRARAYAVTGNPLAAEPDCSYQPTAAAR